MANQDQGDKREAPEREPLKHSSTRTLPRSGPPAHDGLESLRSSHC
jgi:hypothetical protein